MSINKSRAHKKLRIAFDVNNTLTNETVRGLFQVLDREKCYVIVWSSLGREYAENFCKQHGLSADEYMNKQVEEVDIAVDDIPGGIKAAKLVLGVYKI